MGKESYRASYIDEIARDDPNRTFALIPRSTSVEAGYNSISFHQLSQAIDRCAWWIETTLGRSFDSTTLAYIRPLDLLYHILTVAAVKTGHKAKPMRIAFLPSHRNSVEAHVALLDTVKCQILLVRENESLTVSRILDRRTVQKFRIPGIEHFLQDGEVAPYAYEKTFDEARLAPFAVLQTSGSTGIHLGSTLREVLNELVSNSVEHDGEIDDHADFFDLGLDSLQALALSKKINAYLMLKSAIPLTVTPNTIYTHSNVDGLAAVLEPTHSVSPVIENDEEKMQRIFSRCSSSLPHASGGRTKRKGQAVVVLLTASTGSLGSYILDALMQDPRIEKIYCLNRGYDAQTKQTKSSHAKGLSFDWQKVKFIQYDLGKPRLGLVDGDASYDALSQEVTHLIHNAWDVNFKRSLDSFVNLHLRGVSELIHFCTGAQPAARLTFISSESAVLGGSAGSIAKEEIIHDWSRAQNMGYAQSKLIAERIIDQASLPASNIIRVGQIAGPRDGKGVWNRQEWFPSLINSSAHMRKLPDTLPMKKDVDWVPVDIVGKAVVELLFPTPPPDKEAPDGANTDHLGLPSEPPIITAKEPNPATPTFDSTPATLPIPDPPTSVPPPSHPSSPSSPPYPPTHPPTIYHISNPHPLAFSSLIPTIQSACSTQLEIVSLPHWLAELETAIEKGEAGEEMAARSLVEFLRGSEGEGGGGRLDITRARARSGTLAALEGVKGEWVGGWMRGWGV